MVRGGMFSVILSVTWGLGPKCPRFREACCLLVFGLSSGATQVTPATTYHKPKRNTKNHAVPLAAFFARRNGPRAEGTAERSGEERCGRSRVKNGPRAEGAAERSWRRGEGAQESRMVLAQRARRDAAERRGEGAQESRMVLAQRARRNAVGGGEGAQESRMVLTQRAWRNSVR